LKQQFHLVEEVQSSQPVAFPSSSWRDFPALTMQVLIHITLDCSLPSGPPIAEAAATADVSHVFLQKPGMEQVQAAQASDLAIQGI